MAVEPSLFAELSDVLGDTPLLSSAQGEWTGRRIAEGAERFASWLDAAAMPSVPLVAAFDDILGTAVATLAADLARVPVIHVDAALPSPPEGIIARDTPSSARGAYADEALRIHAVRAAAEVNLSGVRPHSQAFLTSGSTGTPVTVVRSAAAVLADAERVARGLGYERNRPVVVGAPVMHVYGFTYGLIAPLLAGVPVHFCGPNATPSQLTRAVIRRKARTLIGHPVQYRLIAQAAERRRAQVVPGVDRAVSAGAPLGPGTAAGILRYHGLTLLNCYGSSEAGAVTLSPVDGTEAPGDAGRLLPGVTARTDDAEELLLRTDSLADGHLTSRGIAPLRSRDGWYPTGDLATVTGDHIRLNGRIATVINVSGKKVPPEAVEHILAAHPAVADATVLGEPDDARGEVPIAHVTLLAAVTVPELLEWCRTRLAPYMLPRRIEIRDRLQQTATGKRLRPSERER